MTVGQLKKTLSQFPDDFKVIHDCSSDYEEYCEISEAEPISSFRSIGGLYVDKENTRKPNSVVLW